MIYQVAEKFRSIQGEGAYAGTPMAFIRFVGCSVSKKVCHSCDTDFEKIHSFRGGGEYTEQELIEWIGEHPHVCLTGGEPLDQDLLPLISEGRRMFHIETSGTKMPSDAVLAATSSWNTNTPAWICVSPKPGFREDVIVIANEVKVIVPGLGSGEGWPTLEDALRWAAEGRNVFLQPRNGKFDVDQTNLRFVLDCIAEHPELRLSLQLHKLLKVQ